MRKLALILSVLEREIPYSQKIKTANLRILITQFIMYPMTHNNKSQALTANVNTQRLITWQEVYTKRFRVTLVICVLLCLSGWQSLPSDVPRLPSPAHNQPDLGCLPGWRPIMQFQVLSGYITYLESNHSTQEFHRHNSYFFSVIDPTADG